MLHVGIGSSTERRADAAAGQVVAEALRDVPEPRFALVFATPRYDHDELARAVSSALEGLPWAGCTSVGVFAGSRLLRDGVVAGVFSSSDLVVGVGVAGPVSGSPNAAGAAAAARALAALPRWTPEHFRTMIIFPDALSGQAAETLRGAALEAGAGCVWAGGAPGDNLRVVPSGQFALGRAYSDHVVVVALDTASRIATGIRHGLRPYGPLAMVTRARGARVAEMDFESAFLAYVRAARACNEDVTTERFAAFAMCHPLGIPQVGGGHVIRDPVAVEPDGTLLCVTEVPDGCQVQVMEGDRASLLAAARDAAEAARDALETPPVGALVFECVSRWPILGRATSRELAVVQRVLGKAVPMFGCLTFGEVGARGRALPQYHNKSTLVVAMAGGAYEKAS